MPIHFQHDIANIYMIKITGLMRKSDMDQIYKVAEQEILKHEKVKTIIVFDQFQGWEKSADWNDLSFFMKHDKNIEKIAAVGDLTWRDQVMAFLGAGARFAAVEYFPPDDLEAARKWIL